MYNYNFNHYFKKTVKRYSKKIAIVDIDKKKYTYDFLEQQSNKFALILEKYKNQTNTVAIDSKKGIGTIIAFLSALKVGLTYFFLDTNLPIFRIKKILKKTNCKLLVSENKKIKLNIKKIFPKKTTIYKNINFCDSANSDTAAYIMFTSGSTGEPKGAIISHQSVINFANWCKQEFDISSKEVFSQLNPLYFDNSVFDLYNSLLHGCKLVLTNGLDIKNPDKLLIDLKQSKCTIWFSTPSLLIYYLNFGLINKSKFKFLKKIIFGGEGFPIPKLQSLVKILPDKSFFNVYGPTECTCICSSHLVNKSDFKNKKLNFVTLGQIAKNFEYLIVDNNFKKVKTGSKGELILFGPNVGHGYIGDPEITTKNFILVTNKLKFNRGYKTGDIVYEKNNNIYFVGRKDTQIKHLGYRIELNELEVTLNKHSDINEACVFYSKNNMYTHGKIMAVISTNKVLIKKDILSFLKKFLPKYFLPQEIFFAKKLPKNSNNKIDRAFIKKYYENKVA